jgi:hypothetical protein
MPLYVSAVKVFPWSRGFRVEVFYRNDKGENVKSLSSYLDTPEEARMYASAFRIGDEE